MDIKLIPIISPGVGRLVNALQGQLMNRINLQMYNLARSAKSQLLEPTAGWSSPPSFTISGSAQQGQVDIYTEDQKFAWFDDGTRPHVILPRTARVLRFRPGARRGRGGRSGGGRSGGMVFARRVYHPGIRPRNISKKVAASVQARLDRYVDTAIAEATQGL
jgi:hypothetical protein